MLASLVAGLGFGDRLWTRGAAARTDVAGTTFAATIPRAPDGHTANDAHAPHEPMRTSGPITKVVVTLSPRTPPGNPAPALRAADPAIRETVVESLAYLPGRRALDALLQAFADPDPAVRDAAAWALGQRGSEDAVAILVSLLAGANARESLTVVDALREIGTPTAIGRLEQIQSDLDPRIREAAAEALEDLRRRDDAY